MRWKRYSLSNGCQKPSQKMFLTICNAVSSPSRYLCGSFISYLPSIPCLALYVWACVIQHKVWQCGIRVQRVVYARCSSDVFSLLRAVVGRKVADPGTAEYAGFRLETRYCSYASLWLWWIQTGRRGCEDVLAEDALVGDAYAEDALAGDAYAEDALAGDAHAEDALAGDARPNRALSSTGVSPNRALSSQALVPNRVFVFIGISRRWCWYCWWCCWWCCWSP